MPLHPEIEAYLDLVEMGRMSGKIKPMYELSPQQARSDFDSASVIMAGESVDVHTENMTFTTRDGVTLNARIYSRESLNNNQLKPALIYFHGGGYVVGSIDSHDALCAQLALHSNSVVISVAYRLAPDVKFPTPVNDAIDAVNWVADQAQSLGLDTESIAFGGDSVGGTLATVLSITAVKEPDILELKPYLQLLFYPVTDPASVYPSLSTFDEGYLLETESLSWFYQHYARTDDDKQDWRFSPLQADDVTGVAPAVLALAEFDPLVDEGKEYASKLKQSGVDVDVIVYEGMTHDFLRMSAIVEDVNTMIIELAAKLR